MTTKTTASAVSRKISSLNMGYEPYNGEYGFSVRNESGAIVAYDFSFSKHLDTNNLAADLEVAGYEVTNIDKFVNAFGQTVEQAVVKGRK